MRIGRYDESIQNYQKALSVDPHFVASHIGISNNYNFKGEYDKARAQLQKLYDSARDDGERRAALFAMTVSYLNEGNVSKGIEEQQAMYALAEKIHDASAMSGDLNTIGTIYVESGKPEEAKKNFDEALRITNESNLSSDVKQNAARLHLYNLGQVALVKKDLTGAKTKAQEFEKQVISTGNRFFIWLSHELNGRIALEEKKFDVAVAELQKSNLLNPQNLYRIGLANEGKGDQAKAMQTYKRVANFNALNSINYAFCRSASQKKVSAT
jgi:tetratricopeptide (TPR) repeat protein